MKLAVVLALLAVLLMGADGRYPLAAQLRDSTPRPDPWVNCETLADPSVPSYSVSTADGDLHTYAMTNCAAGCILNLAPGTYTDTNIIFGDAALTTTYSKTASITPTGDVLIRGTDRNNPPLLRAKVGTKASVIHARNITSTRMRLEDVILDGRRSEQTIGAFTPCTDTTPLDGICDSGAARNATDVHGFYTRYSGTTGAAFTKSCLLRVQAKNFPGTAIQIGDATSTTVQSSTVTDIGCTPALCPAVTLPVENDINAETLAAMGIQFVEGRGPAAIGNTISGIAKIGIECFTTARGCQIIGNTISDAMNAGITFNQGDGLALGNTIRHIGFNVAPNASTNNIGHGISVVYGDPESAGYNTTIIDNNVSDTWGVGYIFSLSSPTIDNKSTFYSARNISSGACQGTTRSDAAAFEMGDSAKQLARIVSIQNTVTGSLCSRGMYVRRLAAFIQRGDSISVSNGAPALDFENVLAVDAQSVTVNDDIDIDANSVGDLRDCTLNSGAAITGAATNVRRVNCG